MLISSPGYRARNCKTFKEPSGNRFPNGGPVRQPYMLYRPARLHRLAESIPRNRLLGSLNVYKYGFYFRYKCGLVWFVEWRCGEGSCVNGTALCDGKKERLSTLSYSISSSFVKERPSTSSFLYC